MVKESTSRKVLRVSKRTKQWLETHTIKDAKEIVNELSSEGEDISDIVGVVKELEEIAHHLEETSHEGENPFSLNPKKETETTTA